MVPCTGSHAHFQRVYSRYRYLECRLRSRRNAQRQATLSRPRLSVCFLSCYSTPDVTSSDHHQLSIILDVLGTPSLDDFYAINSVRSREYIRALPFRKKKNFYTLFPKANPLAVDLLEKCLTFNPKRRIEVGEALAHPYLEVNYTLLISQ
jgi:serine/threonine protein kinase